MKLMLSLPVVLAALLAGEALSQPSSPTPVPPSPLAEMSYVDEFFPGASHDPAIPTPDSVLGFAVGSKAASHAQVQAVLRALAEKSPRCRLVDYAVSHQGKTLSYLVISSEENIRNLDAIRLNSAKLADPRAADAGEVDRLVESMPAIAWMAYVIHGDEMSGTDASLALMWHLASCTDEPVKAMLRETVVVVDPLMNPDGRDRTINAIAQNRTVAPSVDDQSILHTEVWPSGRMNHYLFDLNRDWIFATQPETRGRIAAINQWHPHYFMESHEQGSQDTFLFMPPREPVNPNISANVRKWERVFADDQGLAFDRRGWRYYTGEWNEGWYPGYSGSWAAMRGIVDNLYEQASLMTDGVRRPEGTIESYREGVHKQLVSSIANLRTLQKNRVEVLRGYVADRRENVSAEGPGAKRVFAIDASGANVPRLNSLLESLRIQGVEVYESGTEFAASGRDWLGREFKDVMLPAGTWLVPARQPLGRLASSLLTLDPRMSDEFLIEERRELLRFGQSRLYDITGWNLAMFAGVEIRELDAALPGDAKKAEPRSVRSGGLQVTDEDAVAWCADGADDRSVALAARLMERGVKVRAIDKPTRLDDAPVSRGSVFVFKKDNALFVGDVASAVRGAAGELGIGVRAIGSGMGPGDNPDLGGQHLVLLHQPRIAVLTNAPCSPYSVGEIWHEIDHRMGLRASYLNSEIVTGADLRRYNVLVIPDGGGEIAAKMMDAIKPWVQAGGTLVAIGGACVPLAKEGTELGSTRLLPDVLVKIDEFRLAVIRDHLGKNATVDPSAVWSSVAPTSIEYPWTVDAEKVDEPEAKRRDAWRELFMPQGAMLAARTDDRSWLTAGCGPILPVIYGRAPVLIPSSGMHAPVMLGVIVRSAPAPTPPDPAKDAPSDAAQPDAAQPGAARSGEPTPAKAKLEAPKPGWIVAPPGHEVRLRMSGLLWPEAADRVVHSAYVTREAVGAGQVILFADSPTFRGAAGGTARVFANAVVLGPGMGASQPIKP